MDTTQRTRSEDNVHSTSVYSQLNFVLKRNTGLWELQVLMYIHYSIQKRCVRIYLQFTNECILKQASKMPTKSTIRNIVKRGFATTSECWPHRSPGTETLDPFGLFGCVNHKLVSQSFSHKALPFVFQVRNQRRQFEEMGIDS